jgi:Sec-independent protein translocase protein TatA
VRLGYRIKALQKSMGENKKEEEDEEEEEEEEESLSPICVSSSEREFGIAAA